MDADDLCLPTRFAKQMSYLDAHPECVAVGCRVMLIDPDGDFLCPFVETFEHAAIDAAHMQGHGGAIVHPAAAMRRKRFWRWGDTVQHLSMPKTWTCFCVWLSKGN